MKINEVHYSTHRLLVGKRIKTRYRAEEDMPYYSMRYKKTLTVKQGSWSDGATGVIDLASFGWWVHDLICVRWKWDDGSVVTIWQSSMILHDIMKSEGRKLRAKAWATGTYLVQITKKPFRS